MIVFNKEACKRAKHASVQASSQQCAKHTKVKAGSKLNEESTKKLQAILSRKAKHKS